MRLVRSTGRLGDASIHGRGFCLAALLEMRRWLWRRRRRHRQRKLLYRARWFRFADESSERSASIGRVHTHRCERKSTNGYRQTSERGGRLSNSARDDKSEDRKTLHGISPVYLQQVRTKPSFSSTNVSDSFTNICHPRISVNVSIRAKELRSRH